MELISQEQETRRGLLSCNCGPFVVDVRAFTVTIDDGGDHLSRKE